MSKLQRKIAKVSLRPVQYSNELRLVVHLTDGDMILPHFTLLSAMVEVLGTDVTAWEGQSFDLAITPHTTGWQPSDDPPTDEVPWRDDNVSA